MKAELATAPWALIRSALLDGEVIVYVSDRRYLFEAHAAYPDAVLYLPPEINELARLEDDEEAIQGVHAIKKVFGTWDQELFGAWIVPQDQAEAPAGNEPRGETRTGGRR